MRLTPLTQEAHYSCQENGLRPDSHTGKAQPPRSRTDHGHREDSIMAKQVVVHYTDNYTGKALLEDGETIELTYRGQTHTWDLNPDSIKKLDDLLRPWIECSEVVETKRTARKRPAGGRKSQASTENALIREWAIENGLPVSEKGRIKAEIREAYIAAHADSEHPTAA